MPKYQPVSILGGCYSDENRAFSLQDTVNWLPEQAEQTETLTPTQFKTPPGLRPFLQVSGADAGKPVRGTYNCENKLFAAIGKTLYQITNNGVAIPQGTIPGNTRVTMTHNQISQGNQLVAVNGSSGYVFNTLTQVYEKIVDEGFPGAIWVGFADGYILGVEPGRRFAFNSEPADALNYNTLDRFTSEYKPDLIVTGIVNNNELILLNETSYEFFENTGATQQPFRSKRIYGDVGCASRFGACNLDRTVFMFGADGKFYRLEGYSWQRISTRPIEQAIRGLNWSQAFCYTWDDAGHSVVYWTFPDGFTWGFDQPTQLWHRRKSLGLERWRPNTATQLGQDWYMGDFQSGRIWAMDWDYILEGEDEIESERVTGVLSDNQNLAIVNRLELLFATGQQITVAPNPLFPEQPDGPTITGDAPNGGIIDPYSFAYTVTPGDAPVASVKLRSGTLPPGLTLSNAGVLSGTATTVGTYEYVIRATDTNGLYDDHSDEIIIALPMLLIAGVGVEIHAIPSDDGIDWSANPIASSGTDPDVGLALRLIGLPGRYWGKGISANTAAGYSDDLGASWTATAANVLRGFGQAYTNGSLFLGAHTTDYLLSADDGETFTPVASAIVRFVALNSEEGKLAGILGSNITESINTGSTWSAGVAHGVSFTQGGAQGTDGEYYYFGGNTAVFGDPKLVRFKDGVVANVTLPSFTGGTWITAFSYGNGVKVVGTSGGQLAFDNGSGFQLSTTIFADPVIQIYWNGAVFVALEAGVSATGAIYYSYDGDVFIPAPTYTPLLPHSVAQVMP